MPIIKAVIEYDGTDFFGFQIQPNKRTVQGVIEDRLSSLMNLPGIRIAGSGRTDAGVHATGQVISFSINSENKFPVENICSAINPKLPADIRFKSVNIEDNSFHARYSALSRTYVYLIYNGDNLPVMMSRYVWNVTKHLDVDSMRDSVEILIGAHDFSSFGTVDKCGLSAIRNIEYISVKRKNKAIFIKIRANAFLRSMVRTITGTLAEIGCGKRDKSDLIDILRSCDRKTAGITAPPQGLYLTRVDY